MFYIVTFKGTRKGDRAKCTFISMKLPTLRFDNKRLVYRITDLEQGTFHLDYCCCRLEHIQVLRGKPHEPKKNTVS